MQKIAIVHFLPLELYPPVQNLIKFLEKDNTGIEIDVFTTAMATRSVIQFEIKNDIIKIHRLGKTGKKMGAIDRYWNYCKFYVGCTIQLIKKRPERILYFETISALPAYLYKNFFYPNSKLLIHYHEYTTIEEYTNGMKLGNFFFKLEKKMYKDSDWLSHTNKARMQKFANDILPLIIPHPYILPNYPPASWKNARSVPGNLPVKIVYTGAVSLDTMYTKEFVNWVLAQDGRVIWDIYSLMITDDAKSFLESLSTKFITLNPGIAYENLPMITCKYNIGVILYKGHVPNYIYNSPNKLFEYLAVGLDVWFPDVVLGTHEYITDRTYPKVLAVDFTNLNNFDLGAALDRKGFTPHNQEFYCEKVLHQLQNKLFSNLN